MIQALANRIADYVVRNDQTADQEVLAYGFGLLLMSIATYLTALTSALILGVFREMLIAMAVYMLMRFTIGGSHANHRAICFIVYTGTLYLCIFLAATLSLNVYAVMSLYLVNVILLIMYAPGDTVKQPMVRWRQTRKVAGLLILSCLFIASFLLRSMRIETNILLLMSTITCVFLHPFIYRISGCKRS